MGWTLRAWAAGARWARAGRPWGASGRRGSPTGAGFSHQARPASAGSKLIFLGRRRHQRSGSPPPMPPSHIARQRAHQLHLQQGLAPTAREPEALTGRRREPAACFHQVSRCCWRGSALAKATCLPSWPNCPPTLGPTCPGLPSALRAELPHLPGALLPCSHSCPLPRLHQLPGCPARPVALSRTPQAREPA